MSETQVITETRCFSLMCSECDAGSEYETQTDAEAAGWIGIFDDDGVSWNQMGLCPECALERELVTIVGIVRGIRNANDPNEKECNERWPVITESRRRPACIRTDMEQATDALCIAAANVVRLREWRAARGEDVT